MNIAKLIMSRHTTKAFDPTRKIPAEQMEQIETLLRFSPSSTNAQPWHFFIAASDEGKNLVAKGTDGSNDFNSAKIRNASHVVVLCSRAAIDDAHLQAVLDQEELDGRFANAEARAGQHRGRSHFVNMHRFENRDVQHWMDKQVYLAAGALLLAAEGLEIDACPIEGFNQVALDAALDLRAKGLVSTLVIALGYRSADDFNAALPKSRLPAERVITHL